MDPHHSPANPPPVHAENRQAALELLIAADKGGEFIDALLARAYDQVTKRNRPLLQELTYGVIRHRGTLDVLLDFHLRAPLRRQEPAMAWALRLGAYQLVYLTKIPAHAAVYNTLEALKRIGNFNRKAIGFANAVLHKISAEVRYKTPEPADDPDDPTVLPIRAGYCHLTRPVLPLVRLDLAGHIALKYSHPKWLVERWLARFGDDEARRLCASNNETPVVTARVTALAPSEEEVLASLAEEEFEVERTDCRGVFRLRRGDLHSARARRERWIQIQDETAVRIGRELAPPAGARVADLCAAPGGKAVQLLECVEGSGQLVALDANDERLATLEETLRGYGSSYRVERAPSDPDDLTLEDRFTHILVDAPCSNTGVLGRRPEARWRIRERDLETLPELQGKLLEAAYRHLEPGGRLLYSTCSIEPEENEGAIARFTAAHDDLTELKTEYYLPHRAAGDGGFFSLLLRSR